ncbi:hypothetical protein MCETHM1_01658 [Flavobacteriaceae bacterium]
MTVKNMRKGGSKLDLFFNKAKIFLSKYWLLMLVLLFGLPPLIRYIRTQIALMKGNTEANKAIVNTAQNATANPVTIKKKTDAVQKIYPNVTTTDMQRYSTVAQGVAKALGTNVEDNHIVLSGTFEFFNVSALTENEDEVVRLLKTVPTTFPIVEQLYYNVHTRSRNMKNDLLKYLSKKDLDQIRAVQKKYGKTFI